jgi:hypothetical protein
VCAKLTFPAGPAPVRERELLVAHAVTLGRLADRVGMSGSSRNPGVPLGA